jgi:hypothetical protein
MEVACIIPRELGRQVHALPKMRQHCASPPRDAGDLRLNSVASTPHGFACSWHAFWPPRPGLLLLCEQALGFGRKAALTSKDTTAIHLMVRVAPAALAP